MIVKVEICIQQATSGYKIVTVTTLYYNHKNFISQHLKSLFQSQNDMKHEVFDDMLVPCMYACMPPVAYPGRLGARYTGLGAQALAPKKGFLTSFFSVAIQQRNTLKKSKWLRRQKINRRRRIVRRDCLQKCFHSFK